MAMYDSFSETFSRSRKGKRWKEIDTILDKIRKEFANDFCKNEKYSSLQVLDAGCGSGRLYGFLEEYFPGIFYRWVDISSGMISCAKAEFWELFEVWDIRKLDNFDMKFDIIFSIAAFHHLISKEDRIQSLRAFKNRLKENGYCIFTVWNLLSEKNIARYGERKDEKNDFTIKLWKYDRYYHGFTRQEVVNLLEEVGFVEIYTGAFDTEENLVFWCKNSFLVSL